MSKKKPGSFADPGEKLHRASFRRHGVTDDGHNPPQGRRDQHDQAHA
jgi:hypothetical protein